MTEIRILSSLDEIDAGQWNACFPGEPEDYNYLRAVETSGLPGFTWQYLTAWEKGLLIAAIPAFFTNYSLDSTLDGAGKKMTGAFRSIFPNLLTMKLACLGSPVTEYGLVGFHPAMTAEQRPSVLHDMMNVFEHHAAERGYSLVGIKDVPAVDDALWQQVVHPLGYRGVPGLPIARRKIDFSTIDDYFKTLSYATRKNMRRKLRSFEDIRIEYRDNIDDILDKVVALYHNTRGRAEMTLEELTPKFFQNMLAGLQGRSLCILYFAGHELLAANLLINNGHTLLDKFFCMDGEKGRKYNLYFLSWFTNIHYCLDHNLQCYQSGQAAYENKVKLGCKLARTTMYFKHRNRVIQGALRLAAPFLAADNRPQEQGVA
ncbi:MAG: GNAT family N-acetyltransferase [Proteobacteria bacterium]|nr:GNAT family N-acetyltransferase [Pseudomonadota bacterium]